MSVFTEERYKVIRFYRSGRKKLVMRNVSRDMAKSHCQKPDTRKTDSRGNVIWFDGFTKEG